MSSRRRQSLVDQVRQELLADLMGRGLQRGDKLPNENELADRFAVSRATVREAVLGLLEAGYLVRRHGSGTYVTNSPRGNHTLDSTVSYNAMIRQAGHEPGDRVIDKGVRAPTELERGLLDLGEGENVIEVERLRLADRRPVIYSRDRIPEPLLAGEPADALDSSLYVILERSGHPVTRASARLLPTVADARLARLLELKRGAPLLHIDQVDYDASGRGVMLSLEWHVADAFELIVNRRSTADRG